MIKTFGLFLLFSFLPNSFQAIERLDGTTWIVDEYFEDGDYLHQEYSFDRVDDSTFIHSTLAKPHPDSCLRLLSENRLIFTEAKVRCETKDTSLHLKCITEAKNIYFDYDYKLHGNQVKMRDAWVYLNDTTFKYIIGQRKAGKFTKIYMETLLKRK